MGKNGRVKYREEQIEKREKRGETNGELRKDGIWLEGKGKREREENESERKAK